MIKFGFKDHVLMMIVRREDQYTSSAAIKIYGTTITTSIFICHYKERYKRIFLANILAQIIRISLLDLRIACLLAGTQLD